MAGVGFRPDYMDVGKQFVSSVTNAIWYIDPHMNQVADRGLKVPPIFENMIEYNIPERHKHKKGSLKNTDIKHHATWMYFWSNSG